MHTMIKSNRTLMAFSFILYFTLFLDISVYAQSTSPQQEREQARQNELQRRSDDDRTERIARLKGRFLLQLNQTKELLTQLAAEHTAFIEQLKELLTNDQGKCLVRDPASFMVFLHMQQNPILTIEELKGKQAAVASISKFLETESKQVDVGYLPSAETQQEATELNIWARDRLIRLSAAQAALKTLIDKAPKLDDSKHVPTLAKAIEEYQARWYQVLGESKILGEQSAEKESRQIMVDASRIAKLEQAQAESQRLLEQSRAEITQMKLTYELQILQAKQDAERKQYEAEQKYLDAQAELERLRKDADANRKAKQTEADVARKQVVDEAQKKENIALIHSPEVQQLLAPFYSKGYWLPRNTRGSYEAQPMSLSALSQEGALIPDSDGLQKLLHVATSRYDAQRSRWPFDTKISKLGLAEREKIGRAQKYLIQYGNLMVEEGLLAP